MKKSDVNLYWVYDSWRKNSNMYQCYFKTTPFASLKVYPDFNIEEMEISDNSLSIYKKVEEIIKNPTNEKLYILDMDAEENIDIALLINNNLAIKPILSLNHIFHQYGVVGTKELAEKLIVYSNKLKEINPITYCFILDYNRYIDEANIDKLNMFNNQYEVTEEEFPDATSLEALKIKEVIYIYRKKIKEDVQCYMNYLKENGFITQLAII